MKKAWIIAAAIIIFSSCDDSFLSAPYIPQSNDNEKKGTAPSNVTATHGEKRSITVSWDSVPDAAYYYIYKADSPLDSFILCGETDKNQYTFNVQPGSSIYYNVSSVLRDGKETLRSNYIMGTSLAQPVISDITDISEDSAAVTWYMENVSEKTYKNNLLYIIYCYNGAAEIAQVTLEASAPTFTENRAVFRGLNANTKYEYKVEAFLRSNQSNSEQSDKMDAATARRFRPGKPEKLKAARGTSVDKVELTFELPDMVDIALGDNTFAPKPVYFTISKRIFSESGSNEYQLVCAYFGINSDTAKVKTGGDTFDGYLPGSAVTWTDKITQDTRGVSYEYLVQSYVDDTNKVISSDSSRANATGWALSGGKVSYESVKYGLNANESLFEKAELPVIFEFDPKGEDYTYIVKAKVDPIKDGDTNDPIGSYTIKKDPVNNYENVKKYSLKMNDLNSKSSEANPGRGDYSVYIEVGQQVDGSFREICKFEALDIVQISEVTQPIVVENFRIRDGYTDKFELMWDYYRNRKYIIEQSSNRVDWTPAGSFNDNPTNEKTEEISVENKTQFLAGQPGTTRYIRIKAAQDIGGGKFKEGQWVTREAQTLGVAELSINNGGASYSEITPVWTPAQKADAYRIKYWYTDDSAKVYPIDLTELSVDATGKYKHTFRPNGYNDVSKSGKEIKISVEALNKGLQKEINSSVEIVTTSKENVTTRLVGPAYLDPTASRAASTQEISVSWNSVSGAGGYYVFRRQFNMNNSAEDGTEPIVYYVPAVTSDIKVTGKNLTTDSSNSKIDTSTVKATASYANSRFTLKDIYLPDSDYDGSIYDKHIPAYRNQQNDMVQGMSYRYFVVPVVANEQLNAFEFNYNKDSANKNTDIKSYSIQENGSKIEYSNADSLEREGFTIGFGQNVTATKGTYSSSSSDGRKINNGIEIKWTAPSHLSSVSGFTTRYTVYRRETGSSTWTPVTSDYASTSYVDTTADAGKAYEYVIGINNASGGSTSSPQSSRRFLESCTAQRDEKNRPNMTGYKLGMVKMDSVSKGEDASVNAQYGEVVKWVGAGITSSYNSDSNWGIDGYEVFVMNRNIDANWHSINSMTSVPNQVSLSVTLTPNNTASVNNTVGVSRNLLFVLRDYKHFFKVRSYVLNGDERIYSPDPPYTYTNCINCNTGAGNHTANFTENDYVKWGARQVTDTEYAKIVTIYLAEAFHMSDYWELNTTWIAKATASSNHGGSGSFRHRHTDIGGTAMHIEYSNWKQNMQTRANDWVTFLSIDGKVWASNAKSGLVPKWPTKYGRHTGSSASPATNDRRLKITGPADTPHLYSGEMHFGGDGTTDMTWTAGQVHLRYPTGTTQRTITLKGQDTAMPFDDKRGEHRVTSNDWR